AAEANIEKLRTRHLEACGELVQAAILDETTAGISALIQEFTQIVRGMALLGHRPLQASDAAVSIGERLSAFLMARYLSSQGIPAKDVNACTVIATDDEFGNASPLMAETKARCRETVCRLLDQGALPVVTGFNGSTLDGRPTTLGRGGSDFSASILAAALDAAELWIWTDVDGIMTGDPRLVADARVLDSVTYSEAAELAYNGAKVLHPRTLAPLVERQIPVWSKNSFAPEKPGTRIVPKIETARGPHAVTSMADVALVSIEPANSVLSGTKVMARALGALARANVEVLAITSSSYRQNFCFLVRQGELERVTEYLEESL